MFRQVSGSLKELARLEDLGHRAFGSESYWANSLGSDGMSRRLNIRILGAEEVSRHQMQSKSWPLKTIVHNAACNIQ